MRDRLFQYLQSLVPNWPPYVVKDWIYQAHKGKDEFYRRDPNQAAEFLQYVATNSGYSDPKQIQWQLQVLPMRMDLFDKNTRAQLESRVGGQSHNAYNSDQRHATQANMVANAPSQEPVIMAITPSGYCLIEGWHRTVESLKNWPQGYNQKAWTYKSLKDLT